VGIDGELKFDWHSIFILLMSEVAAAFAHKVTQKG
jgi:hypothetical protein